MILPKAGHSKEALLCRGLFGKKGLKRTVVTPICCISNCTR